MVDLLAAKLGHNALLGIGPALIALSLVFWILLVFFYGRRANLQRVRYGETRRGPTQGGVIHAGTLEDELAERREWLADEAADEVAEWRSLKEDFEETR